MKMTKGFTVLFLGFCVATPARAAVVDCPALDAMEKLLGTTAHVYSQQTGAGRVKNSETIYSGGAVYVLVDGKWTRSPMTAKDMENLEKENRRKLKVASCSHLRDESANGEAASVYTVHTETEVRRTAVRTWKTDTLIWISRANGLPLRSESDLDVGDNLGKGHLSVRYEYRNVQPPAGVQ